MVDALIPLIQITLQEYRIFPDERNLEKLNTLINKMMTVSEEGNSIRLKIHSLLLKTKLEFAKGEFIKVEEKLEKAESLAIEYNVEELKQKVLEEKSYYSGELMKMKQMINSNSTIVKRFEHLELEEYVKAVKSLL